MFDPSDFAKWLRKRYPQYNPLSYSDKEFVEGVSAGNLEKMSTYSSNQKFFMSQIVEYVQDLQLRTKILCLALSLGAGLFFSGIFALLILSSK